MNEFNLVRTARDICQKLDNIRWFIFVLMLAAASGIAAADLAIAQTRSPLTDSEITKRWEVEKELVSFAIIECRLRTY